VYVTLCIGSPNGNNQAFHRGVDVATFDGDVGKFEKPVKVQLCRRRGRNDRTLIGLSEMVYGLRKRGLLLDEIADELENCNGGPECTHTRER
jgi:hypothetical protein